VIAYYKLIDMLNRKGMKKIDLQNAIGCSPVTMASISKNRPVNLTTIDSICRVLNCQPGDILEYIPDNKTTK
jgi:DNA-binding Xre family transcriptional regulator